MCGICGQMRFDNNLVAGDLLNKMLTKLVRRGPDNGDIMLDKNIGLAHRRLAIIDLSKIANQPMIDIELGISLVFNGTIYNYKNLRLELISFGYKFFSSSDSETIIKAYHKWGVDCVLHLDGDFAFAIWDNKQQQLFLARDNLGIKPLYYSINNKSITFASTMQALLVDINNKDINKSALATQLSLHGVVPAPDTIISSINKLTPGHTMLIKADGVPKISQYWYPDAMRLDGNINNNEYIEHTHYLLKEAIKKRMLAADVAVGVLLSGGLDSSLIVAILAELGHKDIRTFSIGFDDIGAEVGSEFVYSDMIVDRFKSKHHKYSIANNEVLARLPEAVANMSEPMVAQDAVAFYLLSEQVTKHIKVVLSGQGADEAFAGYFWYPKMHKEHGSELEKFTKHYLDRPEAEYRQTIGTKYQTNNSTNSWLNRQLLKPNADEFLDKVLRMDITRLVVDDPVKRVDNMTMAWGLEARVPFMDTKLVEWALAMPPSLKLREQGKYPLKKIARQLLPNAVIDRKKGYFPMPALKYVRGEFLEFMHYILTSQACINRGLFKEDYLRKLLAKPEHYMTSLNGSRLWHLALLEFWLQTNVDVK